MFFNKPQSCDMGQTALLPPPKEGMLRIFSPEKSDGFGRFVPANLTFLLQYEKVLGLGNMAFVLIV
jgi:hypothetical protein